MPIELRRRFPDLPIICDPSHICGIADMLLSVSQVAMDLNYNGLMLESHITPKEAWSDAKQQITPAEFGDLLKQLVIRKVSVDDAAFLSKLEDLRDKIDKLDTEVINTLAERMKIAEDIGRYKKEKNITILQSGRWDEIVKNRLKQGTDKNLTKDFVLKLFEIVHQESIQHQTKIMNEDKIKTTL
jgi:chorismate mutase